MNWKSSVFVGRKNSCYELKLGKKDAPSTITEINNYVVESKKSLICIHN